MTRALMGAPAFGGAEKPQFSIKQAQKPRGAMSRKK